MGPDQRSTVGLRGGWVGGVIDKEESPVGQLLLALAVPTSSFSPPHLLPLLVRDSGSVPDLHVLGLSFDTPHPTPANEKDERGAAREKQETPHPSTHLFPALIGPEATSSCRLSAALGEI